MTDVEEHVNIVEPQLYGVFENDVRLADADQYDSQNESSYVASDSNECGTANPPFRERNPLQK